MQIKNDGINEIKIKISTKLMKIKHIYKTDEIKYYVYKNISTK
jgi:hypothetical protein